MRLADLPPLLRDEPALTRALGEPVGPARRGRGGPPDRDRRPGLAVAAAVRSSWPARPARWPPSSATISPSSCPPARSPCSRRGRRCRSSGSARRSRRWASASSCCGGCATPSAHPAVIVTGVRALLQRLGPDATAIEPISVHPSDVVDPDELVARLAQFGYRREELVEHRGEFARRGAIIDVFPSTGDQPIRIDLWGDEVDRLTRFSASDQRSTDDLAEACIFPARELIPTDEVRARASKLVGAEPWGREQWERLGEGLLFDGMESWLPWLTDRERAAHRRAARHGQGRARRAAADARPGRRPARRGGRPRQGAGLDVGARPRQAVPAPPRGARPDPRRAATRRGPSTRRRSRPTRPSCRRRAGVRSSATAAGSSPASPSCSPTATASSSPPTARARPSASPACCATSGLDLPDPPRRAPAT